MVYFKILITNYLLFIVLFMEFGYGNSMSINQKDKLASNNDILYWVSQKSRAFKGNYYIKLNVMENKRIKPLFKLDLFAIENYSDKVCDSLFIYIYTDKTYSYIDANVSCYAISEWKTTSSTDAFLLKNPLQSELNYNECYADEKLKIEKELKKCILDVFRDKTNNKKIEQCNIKLIDTHFN